jgi:Zn-finger nucleic acid-binding protein
MRQSAGSLHCPNCGGPAAPGDPACKYCHAKLATVSCPSCFALMFEGAIYCPQCGVRRARATEGPRTARCPGCKATMHEVEVGSTAFLECEKCSGTWMDAHTFERLCANREAQAAVLHRLPTGGGRTIDTTVRYRPCVTCGTMMNRLNFGKLSGTVVDVCKGHGTFLDCGELHQIVTFIQNGGLERARQRQLEDLQDAEKRLRAIQNAQSQSAGMGAEHVSWGPVDAFDILAFLKDLVH